MLTGKVQATHISKSAYVYLRQSSMGQVRHHRESTERQYALKGKAESLGWPVERIRILDRDLGVSGTQIAGREDFKTLVADVSMRRVGAVFALEASRLARSCLDWHRLLELCALTGTLIIDEDGCYDPRDFNDQLLLGLKGTMSQAELHFLRARLHGGKVNKARKGELRFSLPAGFCYDPDGKTVIDPDRQVQGAVRLVFDTFRKAGSACAVVRWFAQERVSFPKRVRGGALDKTLLWGRLTHTRVLDMLKNAAYAGVYVFGRYRVSKEVSSEGGIQSRTKRIPRSAWGVSISDHHEAYIDWEEYLKNQERLQQNQPIKEGAAVSSAAREGHALLQGLLLCGSCGRRLSTRYAGSGGIYPMYDCSWRRREGLSDRPCMTIQCGVLDEAICKKVLEVLKPSGIEIAIQAVEELGRREEGIHGQWRMQLERAEYEAQLAQRRYEEVDPANRLVAATLELRWNESLKRLEELKKEYERVKRTKLKTATPEQRAKILSLAQDFPRLWQASTTQARDRKRMLRLLIKDITVEKLFTERKVVLHVRWQGGAQGDIVANLPLTRGDQLRYPKETVERIRTLAATLPDDEIAEVLNREGIAPSLGGRFTSSKVRGIRVRYGIAPVVLKHPDELSVEQVAEQFGVTKHVVRYWIRHGILKSRKYKGSSPHWIRITPDKERELYDWVRNSTKIQKAKLKDSHL